MSIKLNRILAVGCLAFLAVGLVPLALLLFLIAAAFNVPTGLLGASPFQDTPCSVVVSNSYDTCGTITRASVAELTPSQLEELFKPSGLFADMDAWFRTSFVMNACGTKRNGLYDWIFSSMKQVGSMQNKTKLDRGPSLLQPFILARQDSVVNTTDWTIVNGAANSAYTGDAAGTAVGTISTGPLTAAQKALGGATDRIIRVQSPYGVDMDAKWFVSRDRVYIFGRSGGTSQHGQWKVLASAADTALSYVDVLITSENAGSTVSYATAPTAGVLVSGGPSVNDFESWCNNRPAINPRKHVPFWIETTRRSRRVDSETKRVFARLSESNKYFDEFQNLEMSEYNRQDEELFQRQRINAFFWGKKKNANQTLTLWQSLPQITTVTGTAVDPGLGGKLVAYEAYQIGVIEQLRACGRVRDLQNNALNMYEFLDEMYRIMRSRKSQGRFANSIDVWTDSRTAANFETAFIAYMKLEYGGDILNLAIEKGSNTTLGINWKSYTPKFPQGVEINIITHEYFDDWVNAFDDQSIGSAGRMMLILDIGKPGAKGGTIYPGMVASNSKMSTLGDLAKLRNLDPTFACVMEHVTEEINLVSETSTAVVECPENSLAIIGIADAVPTTAGKSGDYYSGYVDLY